MKILVNACYGGFRLDPKVYELYRLRTGKELNLQHRDDPDLTAVVQELGLEEAAGSCCELAFVEIPDEVEWQIESYDGKEWVAEKHRKWCVEP